jgi:hypothetical protein
MRYLSDAPNEEPQRTHFWNNHHLRRSDTDFLRPEGMVYRSGDPHARTTPLSWLNGAFAHMPRYGGWSTYLVLQPTMATGHWHVGWRLPESAGVSRIPIRGPLRVLVGPGPTEWFGISVPANIQIPIECIGSGVIGHGGRFAQLPLL